MPLGSIGTHRLEEDLPKVQRYQDTKKKIERGVSVHLAVPDESAGDPEECRSPSKGICVKESRPGQSLLNVADCPSLLLFCSSRRPVGVREPELLEPSRHSRLESTRPPDNQGANQKLE